MGVKEFEELSYRGLNSCGIIVPTKCNISSSVAITRTGHKVAFCDCV